MNKVTLNILLLKTLLIVFLLSPQVLAEKACVKSESGKVVCGELVPKKPSSINDPSLKQKITIKTQSGVDFTLNGCSKSRDRLICLINIYNSTDFDKRVLYGGYFTIIDNEGNTYQTPDYSIGNRYQSEAILPPKSTTKSQVFFKPNGPLNNYVRLLKGQPRIDDQYSGNDVIFRDFKVN
jgi:hypothetical protein